MTSIVGVNHFHNLFDVFFDDIFPREAGTHDEMRRREKIRVLERAREVNAYRNAMSHPSEQDLPYRDGMRLLDSAHRLLRKIDSFAADEIDGYERQLDRGVETSLRSVDKPHVPQGEDFPVVKGIPRGISAKRYAYHLFFTDVLNRILLKDSHFTNSRAVGHDNWKSFSVGRTGFSVVAEFMTGPRLLVHLYIDTDSKEANKYALRQLLETKEPIEQAIGEPLTWDSLDHRRACRVYAHREGGVESSPERVEVLKAWAVDSLLKFKEVFGPRIRLLRLDREGRGYL